MKIYYTFIAMMLLISFSNADPHKLEKYFYKNGNIKLIEKYDKGQLVESTWFLPEGGKIRTEYWVNRKGTAIYLREDGSIMREMQYQNGLANGISISYDENGAVEKIAYFRNGKKVNLESNDKNLNK